MSRKPSDERIKGIVSSMQIEGFPATYESVKKSLEELFEHYDEEQMDSLIAQINKPGADRRQVILKFVNDIEDKIEKSKK